MSRIGSSDFLIQAWRGKLEKYINVWGTTIQNFEICVYIKISNPLCHSLSGCKGNPGYYIKVKLPTQEHMECRANHQSVSIQSLALACGIVHWVVISVALSNSLQ